MHLLKLKLNRIILFLFLFIALFFIIPVSSFLPANAQSQEFTPEEIGKAWQVGRAFERCTNWLPSMSPQQMNNIQWFLGQGRNPGDILVGHLTKEDNGTVTCRNQDEMRALLEIVGISNPRQFLVDLDIYALDPNDPQRYLIRGNSEEERAAHSRRVRDAIASKYNFQYSNGLGNATKYALIYGALQNQCLGEEASGGVTVNTVNPQTGDVEPKQFSTRRALDHSFTVGFDLDADNRNRLTCSQAIARVNELADDYSRRIKRLLDAGVNVGDVDVTQDNSCETNSGVLGWIMCPIAGILDTAVGFLDDQIRQLLYVKESYFTAGNSDQNGSLKDSWEIIRNIAYTILIPVMLVMVIGTVLGFEVFSAYTIKKALPRMVIAIIFMTLSWYICVLLVDFFNMIGLGIRGIITSPFNLSGAPGDLSPLQGALTRAGIFGTGGSMGESIASGAGLGVLAAGGLVVGFSSGAVTIGILISTLTTAALILGAIFLLLVARQMIILALVVIAPLAILSWIFPGNEKLWKLWWGSFTKLLMLYPLIMLLIGIGQVFATITADARQGENQLITIIIIIAAYVMPFFFIPFAFKWAGGVFGNIAGMVNDRERGALDRLRKGRSNMRAKHMENAKNFQRFKGNNALTRGLNDIGGMSRNRPGAWMTPSRLKNTKSAAQDAYAAESLKNNKVFQSNQNDDNFLLALGDNDLAKKKLATAQRKLDEAKRSGSAEDIAKYQYEVNARQGGLANASLIPDRASKGVQMAAVQALAATGYQYSAGNAGYKELAGSIRNIVGDDDQSFASAMNNAQYSLKKAGRADLGGIDNGGMVNGNMNVDSAKGAFRKFSNYQRGQLKTETYHGGAGAWLGKGAVDTETGKTIETPQLTQHIQQGLADGSVSGSDVAEYHKMLTVDYQQATDVNKAVIKEQLRAIETATASFQGQPTGGVTGVGVANIRTAMEGVANNKAEQRTVGNMPNPYELENGPE